MADWIPVRFRELLDVVFGTPSDGDAVTYDSGTDKLVLGPPAPVAPTGPAGGVLSGTYPDPGFAEDMATQAEQDALTAATAAALAANAAASVNDGDPAGGVLSGTYPNPGFAADMATQAELNAHEADTSNVHGIADTTVLATDAELAAAVAASEAGQVRDGDAAGGDLTGTYPNPQIAANAVGAAEIANGAVGTTEVADESVTVGKINSGAETPGRVMVADGTGGAIWDNQSGSGGGSPTGPAGGVLDGTYPMPGLAAGVAGDGLAETADVLSVNVDGSTIEIDTDALRVKADGITSNELAPDSVTATELAADSVTSSELAPDAVTNTELLDGAVTASKVDSEASLLGDVLTSDGAGGAVWVESSGGGSSTLDVNQTGHAFDVGDVLRFADPVYVLAQADTEAHAEVAGIVAEVTDADNFVLLTGGPIDVLSGLDPTEPIYYLSDTVAGALTPVEPEDAFEVSKPLLIPLSATTGIFVNMRGGVIPDPDASAGSGSDALFRWMATR